MNICSTYPRVSRKWKIKIQFDYLHYLVEISLWVYLRGTSCIPYYIPISISIYRGGGGIDCIIIIRSPNPLCYYVHDVIIHTVITPVGNLEES